MNVMIVGLSYLKDQGKMARLVAEAINRQPDMSLCPRALSESDGVATIGEKRIQLYSHSSHFDVLSESRIDLVVDFTLPDSVNRNVQLYCETGKFFVMGTTGGNRELLKTTVENSSVSAVIAPNMAVPVVMFQEMMRFAAENFLGALTGYELSIQESHQEAKRDVSGTAVSLLPFFARLGMPLEKDKIQFERNPDRQTVKLGIPQKYLSGHGYHTYTMRSADGTVMLEFKHNVHGRSVYVDGVLRAIRFLAKRKEVKGKVFTMLDVLKG